MSSPCFLILQISSTKWLSNNYRDSRTSFEKNCFFCVGEYAKYGLINKKFDGPKPELFGRYIDDCLGATSCTKEELERFIGFVNSFHPALKFTWEISETSVTFLDINISVQDNKLATSVHYKPTDSHSYLLYSSSTPISRQRPQFRTPQFLSTPYGSAAKIQTSTPNATKCPISFPNVAIRTASCLKHFNRVQNVNRESALEPSASDNEERIPFTLTFHPNNLAARNVALRNFKILQSPIRKQHQFSLIRHSSHSNAIET